MLDRNACPERRVSPEASSFAKASEDIPRSFNEGELAKGDYHELCLSAPIALESLQSFGWQAIFFHHDMEYLWRAK